MATMTTTTTDNRTSVQLDKIISLAHLKIKVLRYFLEPFLAESELSNRLLSVVVSPSVRPSVRLSITFSHFHLLLKNHRANFNLAIKRP